MQRKYVFTPLVLLGPLLRFLESYRQSCTMLDLGIYPENIGGLCFNLGRLHRVC